MLHICVPIGGTWNIHALNLHNMHVDTGGSLRRKTFSNWWKCYFLSKTNHFHVSIVIWSDLKLYICYTHTQYINMIFHHIFRRFFSSPSWDFFLFFLFFSIMTHSCLFLPSEKIRLTGGFFSDSGRKSCYAGTGKPGGHLKEFDATNPPIYSGILHSHTTPIPLP